MPRVLLALLWKGWSLAKAQGVVDADGGFHHQAPPVMAQGPRLFYYPPGGYKQRAGRGQLGARTQGFMPQAP